MKRTLVAFSAAAIGLTMAMGVVIPAASAGADVSRTPVTTGCPAGYPSVNIQDLESAQGHPYFLAELLDQTGNQNGFICAKQISDGELKAKCGPDCPFVLFSFIDDDNPAQLHAQAG
jgi:hypothetical protein